MAMLKLLDEDGTLIARLLVTGTSWRLMGNSFQNAHALRLDAIRDGKPVKIDLVDDDDRTMLKNPSYLKLDKPFVGRGELITFATGDVRFTFEDMV